jgi:hypothetical protein
MRPRFKHIRRLRLWHLAGFLALALFVVLAGVVIGARTGYADYGCLQVDSFVSRTLIDLRTGLRADKAVSEQRLASAGSSVVPPISWSPDRQHVAYTTRYIDPAGSTRAELFVRAVRWAGIGDPILVEPDFRHLMHSVFWSPDSQYFAHSWELDDGQYTVGVASTDGQKYTSIVGKNQVAFFGWAADSAYLVFVIAADGSQHTLLYWSRDTRQFIEPYAPMQFTKPVWSPRGHQFAYLSFDASGKELLVISTPGSKEVVTFDLPGILRDFSVFWSPDGRYVTLAYTDRSDTNLYRLSVFGVDGTSYPGISELVSGSYPPSVIVKAQWAADGHSLVYMEIPDSDDSHARLVAFHVDSGQRQILLTDVQANVFYMPDGRFMQTAWESGSRVVAGFVDVTTGASHPFLAYYSRASRDLWPSPDRRRRAHTRLGQGLAASGDGWRMAAQPSRICPGHCRGAGRIRPDLVAG